jgi:ribosomal protein L16 Arg81 hydroxylase
MTSLRDLVSPGGVEDFLDTTWGRQAEVYPGEPGRYEHLLPWTALNDILRRSRLGEPRLRLAHDGERIPAEEYTSLITPRRGDPYRRIDHGTLAEKVRDGATLVIDSIDELYAPIDDLAGDLERVLRERVQVNCYISFGAKVGFATHWDDHDVLAVQVHGRKHWRVFGPTRPAPLRRDVAMPEPPTGDPVKDFVLTDGEVLHVPRGWWHDASAMEGPSLHLTFGVGAVTGVDLVAWVADELRRHELARTDLPRRGDNTQYVKELAELVAAELAEPDVLQRFLADRDGTAVPRARAGFPFSVRDKVDVGSMIRLNAPRARLIESGDTVSLRADGKSFTFAGKAGPVLRALHDGEWHSVGDLVEVSGGLPEGTVRSLCTELVRRGAAAVGARNPS